MEVALYTYTTGFIGEAEIARHAHKLGYEMVKFNGWDGVQLGNPSGPHKGPRRDEATANARKLQVIAESMDHMIPAGEDPVSIFQVQPC